MKEVLTAREQDLLNYLIEYKKTNGCSPSYQEMKDGINTKSDYHINGMLDSLEDKGYILRKHNKHRTIRVLKFL